MQQRVLEDSWELGAGLCPLTAALLPQPPQPHCQGGAQPKGQSSEPAAQGSPGSGPQRAKMIYWKCGLIDLIILCEFVAF